MQNQNLQVLSRASSASVDKQSKRARLARHSFLAFFVPKHSVAVMCTRKAAIRIPLLIGVVLGCVFYVVACVVTTTITWHALTRYPAALSQRYADMAHFAKAAYAGACPTSWDTAGRKRHDEFLDRCQAVDFNGSLDQQHAVAHSAALNTSIDLPDWWESEVNGTVLTGHSHIIDMCVAEPLMYGLTHQRCWAWFVLQHQTALTMMPVIGLMTVPVWVCLLLCIMPYGRSVREQSAIFMRARARHTTQLNGELHVETDDDGEQIEGHITTIQRPRRSSNAATAFQFPHHIQPTQTPFRTSAGELRQRPFHSHTAMGIM